MLKRNLLTSLILYESLRTTRSRAKAVSVMMDRMMRNVRKQSAHNAIRYVNEIVTDKNACRKVMQVLMKRYEKRESGLTIIKAAGSRIGDGAMLVDLTLVDAQVGSAPEQRKTEKPAKKAAKKEAKADAQDAGESKAETSEAPKKKAAPKKADSSKKNS